MNLYPKLLLSFFGRKRYASANDGFTLVELLVVVIILTMLTLVSLPNFMNQIGKARESETKNYLGLVARGQQAYHWEKRTFAAQLALLGMQNISSKYHNIVIPDPSDVSDTRVKHQAFDLDGQKDQVRNFAVGVYFSGGLYTLSLCQSEDIAGQVNVGDTADADCTNNGIKLK